MRSLFYIGFREIQINTNFSQIRQKRQYNLKTTIFGRSSPKSIRFLRKHIQITMQKFKAIGATFFELSRDKKLTTYTQTHIHTFSADNFFAGILKCIFSRSILILALIRRKNENSRFYEILSFLLNFDKIRGFLNFSRPNVK